MSRTAVTGLFLVAAAAAASPKEMGPAAPAERGRDALIGRSFTPASWTRRAYDEAWKLWGLEEKPADYHAAFRRRYGLHPSPYENNGLPMGLREAPLPIGFGKGIAQDCMICHGGSIMGKSIIGLPNSSIDYQALNEELTAADGMRQRPNFVFANVRGTTEAAALTVLLFEFRDADLNVVKRQEFGYRNDLCEDAPAWWLLKKKKTMYHTGSSDARSVRALMQFMLSPLAAADAVKKEEATFRDIQAFLLSIEPPRYPFAIDEKLAAQGKELFLKNCASCHGTYGKDWTYPNKIVPLEQIGTDPNRAGGLPKKFQEHFVQSWFGQETGPDGKRLETRFEAGYQAPPLDGVWATAPYFHNGSVPTLYHVLNSKTRPAIFTRSYGTDEQDYDKEKVGWKITVLERPPGPEASAFERRKVYDTSLPGRSNRGHTFGDKFTEDERRAVIEYLKTL